MGFSQQKTKSGISYEITSVNEKSESVSEGDEVIVKLKGYTKDGVVFQAPAKSSFVVGSDGLLLGFNEALTLLKVQEKGTFEIPQNLAYGMQGLKDDFDSTLYVVEPLQDIIFDIKIIKKVN